MYSWLWVKLKWCQYKFIMVSKRAHNRVKETPMQPYQTIVSIEWQPCFVHRCSKLPWSMPKNITATWAGTVDWNLHFPLLKKSSIGTVVSTKRRPGSPIAKTTNANTKCYVRIYIYTHTHTVFAIAVYLGSTYILIYILYIYTYMKYQLTSWI